MKNVTDELREIVNAWGIKISNLPDEELSAKPHAHKWSKKEVLGHLIDSGQNNLRRFICGQYEEAPPKITYQQDFWVVANQYQRMEKKEVIELWRLTNRRICAVLDSMPKTNYGRQCDTGALHSLEWLAADYVKHMKHHLNQIISGSYDVIYE
jgi:hypothetical protein